MPGDIKVPGLGDIPKKYAIGAVATAAGLGIIVYIRSRKAAQTAAAAGNSAAATANGAGYDPNAIDPATGVPYSQESGSYGYGQDNYGGSSGYYGSTGYDQAGYPIGSSADLQYQNEQVSGIQTNDEWVQQAIGGSIPGDPGTIQAALSAVLGGLTVTTAQKNLFLEAVGVLGQPPHGYPTPIKTSDTAGHPGTGQTTGVAQVKVPDIHGKTVNQGQAVLRAAGLTTVAPPGSSGYHITGTTPAAGTMVPKGSAVSIWSVK